MQFWGQWFVPWREAWILRSATFSQPWAVAIVGLIFVVRRTLVLRSAESLASPPDDALALGHWKSGYFATYALSEALVLFGLILRFTGGNFERSFPFYIGGFALLFFFAPKEPAAG